MIKRLHRPTLIVFSVLLTLGLLLTAVWASHSWNGYHWARQSNPFTLKLGDNVSGTWDSLLVTASGDWSQSTKLDTTIVAGGTRPKSCRPTNGRVEVCSASYGNTGWLGLAQIWITGGEHIVQGIVKNNNYYFSSTSTYQYNNTAEMQHVICQEIGHTLGLDHQSTSGASLNTCMDYYHNKSASDTKSTHPDTHDYDELVTIYTHLDNFTSVLSPASSRSGMPPAMNQIDFATPEQWGRVVQKSEDGRPSLYMLDFGGGNKVFTWVIWVR